MKFAFLSAVLLLLTPCFAKVDPAVDKAHEASYHIAQGTVSSSGLCSATAIGPQALLTATHCEEPTDDIEIVGSKIAGEAIIVARLRDSLDHTIFLVKNISFPVWVDVLQDKPELAQDVFSFGNPGDWIDIFQKGYIAGIKYDTSAFNRKPPLIFIAIQAYEGSSGSGVFNTDGVLIVVLSYAASQKDSDGAASISFAAAYPLHFEKAALDKARTFTVAPDPAPETK